MFNAKKFGMHVASHRRGLGLSLRYAAKILGISAATLSRVERAEKPDIDTFVKICQWAKWSKKGRIRHRRFRLSNKLLILNT